MNFGGGDFILMVETIYIDWVDVVLLLYFYEEIMSSEWVCGCNFRWNDDEVRFVLDQHAELDFYSASSLKQQSMLLHSDTLFWFRTNQSLLFLLNAACLAEKQQIPIL